MIKFRQKTKVDLMHVIALVQERGDLQLVPPSSLKLDLKREAGRAGSKPSQTPRKAASPSLARPKAKIQRKPSWWTARATAGEVTPGFTKAEILKQAPEDPARPTES